MEYSTLDKLGVRVSRLGFGCMRFPLTAEGKIDEPRAAAMLDTAYKAGVTYYDTAYFYHQHTGEAFLGRAMKRYPRDTFYLATKMPMSIVESLDHAKEIFEGQLAALQTDYVDFYLLHGVNGERWKQAQEMGIVDFLLEMQKAGRIRHFGFSFHGSYEEFETILTARDWDFCQIQFNYMDQEIQAGMRGYALAEKLGVQVNGQPVTDGLADNENGEDILAHDGLIYGKNAQIFAWPGFDTAVWELRNDQTGKLPRIRGTNADPTLGLSAQSIMVTCDVELNGDAGVSGFRYKVNDAANDTEYSGVFTVNLLDKLEIEPTIRTGYAFAQWSDGKTDNPYTMAVPGTVSLTAQTQIETYTIDYELNGGALEAGKTNPATYTLETAALRLEKPTRTGYTFAGWTGSNGTTPQTDVGIVQGSTGNLYFEANWTANGYKILYTGVEGADVSTFPTKHVFGKDTAIPNPTKTDYSFAGWKVNGSAAARDLTLSGTAYTADITLEATWTANEFTITYSGVEGADVSTFPTKHVFGKDTAIPTPTKTGYGFAGWKVNGSAATRDLTLSGTAYTADIALEATWTKLTEPTPSVIMEGGTAFIVGKATEDAIMHIGKGVANFGVANLDYVDVDGKRLDPQFYTAKDGSILITVHQAYLNTLSVGEHILTAHLKGPGYEGQTVSGKIVVAPVPDMSNLPQTGDASPVLLWGATLGLCAAVLAVMKRKKK